MPLRPCTRIVVTYDLWRISHAEPGDPLMRFGSVFFHLFRRVISEGSGLPVAFVSNASAPEAKRKLYAAYCGNNVDINDVRCWQSLYHAAANSQARELLSQLYADALVIGYELSPFMKRAFQELAIPYIDLTVHPVRFFQDLLFAFSSNIPGLNAFFQEQSCPERLFYHAASHQQARYAPNTLLNPINRKTLMVIGQTEVDKVLLQPDGSVASLADHIDALRALMGDFEQTCFKPHPAGSSDAVMRFFQAMPNTLVLPDSNFPDLNMYVYLCHPSITTFAGLNSSVLIEAKYFEKQSVNFIDFECNYAHDQSNASNQATAWPIFRSCFTSQFWRSVMLRAGLADLPAAFAPDMELFPNLRLFLRGLGSFDDAQSYTHCCRLGRLDESVTRLEAQWKEGQI